MSQELRSKLAQAEAEIDRLREERGTALAERNAARDAYSKTDGLGQDSQEFKDAQAAVGKLGTIDEQIANAQATQVGILRMLGEDPPEMAAAREAAKNEALAASGRVVPSGWDARSLLTDPGVKSQLEHASHTKSRFGSIELGALSTRDALAADITGTTEMRLGTYQGVVPQLLRPLRVLDLIPIGTMDGNAFYYTQEGGTFLAQETAEGTTKPEDGVTFTDAEAVAQTIAAWQKIRKQALSDVAALQTIIQTRLRYSVMRRLEHEALAGDGVGSDLLGILNTTGIGAVPYAANTPLTELVLAGITSVLLADAEASGIVMNPIDWQTALTQKAEFQASQGVTGGSGEYIGGGPFGVTPQLMWGVPLIPSPAIPQGQALVGDFGIGATIMIREGVNVLFSDSDGIDFIQNRVTLLAEMRAALPVWRPMAFTAVQTQAQVGGSGQPAGTA